jgi:Ser-tRNA(Ala) deacylase AlaX
VPVTDFFGSVARTEVTKAVENQLKCTAKKDHNVSAYQNEREEQEKKETTVLQPTKVRIEKEVMKILCFADFFSCSL